MRIISTPQARYWLAPRRLPQAVRRLAHARAGSRWCREAVTPWEPSGRLGRDRGPELDEARRRVEAVGLPFGGPANLDLLFDLSEEVLATRVVETGVAFGWSSLALLLSVTTRGGHLWSVDLPYPYLLGEDHVSVAVPDRLRSSWTLLRGPDREQLPTALAEAGAVDLAHYDSDKSYEGALWAYGELWEALRPGGVLVADDVDDHLAFRDFAGTVGRELTVVCHSTGFQGILRK